MTSKESKDAGSGSGGRLASTTFFLHPIVTLIKK
jgi:hypothetical protein